MTSTETLVCASEATLRQREVTGKLLVFTDHIVRAGGTSLPPASVMLSPFPAAAEELWRG